MGTEKKNNQIHIKNIHIPLPITVSFVSAMVVIVFVVSGIWYKFKELPDSVYRLNESTKALCSAIRLTKNEIKKAIKCTTNGRIKIAYHKINERTSPEIKKFAATILKNQVEAKIESNFNNDNINVFGVVYDSKTGEPIEAPMIAPVDQSVDKNNVATYTDGVFLVKDALLKTGNGYRNIAYTIKAKDYKEKIVKLNAYKSKVHFFSMERVVPPKSNSHN